ncbi:Bardet-Biedl syndrome 7 protein homolog [Euwallacea similis]|uniref:Bardet-Biedl syndrome 7 protein homolog n=1 Tax=Euwallacea similis TaxID=1736056 RepID=UPI00344E8348
MELQLSRVDYTVMGVANKNCLRLLPAAAPKEPQKVAIADTDGILQIFSVRKDDIQLHFKTLPGPAITSLKVAGASGTVNDKVFIAAGNEIKGYTKKGKLFLVFDSGMTEDINSMFVLGNELFLCGKHVFNHYRDCKEVGSYLCGDTIVDVTAFYMLKNRRLTSLIACEGRMIRVLEHARVTASMEVESSPTVLHIHEEDDSRTVLFGTVDGRIGILDVESLQGFQRWLISNDKNLSSIICIESYDMSGGGTKNLILGRQDGNIEIYSVNMRDKMDTTSLIFLENCNECIMSLQCGIIAAKGYDEVLAVTYSGRIFGLTTQVTDANFDGSTGSYVFTTDASTKISKLKNDIEELQAKLNKEREKYQEATLGNMMELSAISLIPINTTFILDRKTASYLLTLEAPTAIDHILIECNTKIDLLDVEKNTAVISYSETANFKGSPHLLATYRCQLNTNRIELKIQSTEGEKGLLQAYISPVLQPRCSRLLQFDIKALSLHYRVNEYSDLNRPFSVIKFKGTFSLAEIHNWISQCLPEVPGRPQMSEQSFELFFQSSLLDSVLICTYKKSEAEFKSDNLTTLCVLKEVLSVEATNKKTKIDISLAINDQCIDHILKMVKPKLLEHKQFLRDKELFDALNELEIAEEENVKYLSEKYRGILLKKSELVEHFKTYPDYLDRLYDSILSLLTSYNKLKGLQLSRQKIEDLKRNLENYSFDDLIGVFRSETASK